MPYYDKDETREERDRREERHRTSLKRTAAEHQALTAASGHLIGRLLLIPFKCIVKLTLWSSRYVRIPEQSDHRIRSKVISHSGGK